METSTIIIIALSFVFGIMVGVTISWNRQVAVNKKLGCPTVCSRYSSANSDAEKLTNFIRRRMNLTGVTFFQDWFRPLGIRDAQDLLVPRSGHSPWMTQFCKLLAELGLEMELRNRTVGKLSEEIERNNRIYINTHFQGE